MKPTSLSSRREFLKRTAAIGATGIASPLALNLSAIGRLAAAQADDYKALVCVFLYGGNDNYNTLVPYDTDSYKTYSQARASLATPYARLGGTILDNRTPFSGGELYALAPELTGLHQLWQEGNLGITLNIGPLIQPTSKADFSNRRLPLPPKIFSHNDQQSVWQSLASEGATSGWGGRIMDLFADSNTDEVFSAVSVTGDSILLSGSQTTPYSVSSEGAIQLRSRSRPLYGSAALSAGIEKLMTAQQDHLLRAPLAAIARRSFDAQDKLSSALQNTTTDPSSGFKKDRLSQQLAFVSKMLASREQLGVKRQVFFVGLGGFDNHDSLVSEHPANLAAVNDALTAFYKATVSLGLENNVTTFTASDFGRTLTANGDGTDHGWGSHHFVVGGAVNGELFYGTPPLLPRENEIKRGGPDDVGRGRLLPTLSVEQLGATLGGWFGASPGELLDVFPRLSGFNSSDIGLFSPS